MVLLFLIIRRARGEERFREPLSPLLRSGRAHTPGAVAGPCGTWICSKPQGFLCFWLTGTSAIERSFPGTEKLRNWGLGGESFLSCSTVTEFLQLPVYLKTYYWNNSFPIFMIHILSSCWLFVTTPSLLFSAGEVKTYSVSLLYSCFASWCCATPEIVIPRAVSSNVELGLYHCVLSKIHDSK